MRADVRIEDFEGSMIVVADVPETAPYLKPCYVKARGPYDGAFVRMGEGDRKLSRYEVDRLIEERQQPKYDAQMVGGSDISELDPELTESFLKRECAASPRVFAGLSDADALLTIGVFGVYHPDVLISKMLICLSLMRNVPKHVPKHVPK